MSDSLTNNIGWARPQFSNYEEKTLNDLKEFRKRCNVEKVQINTEHEGLAYIIRMIDILLDKVEELENK